MCATVQLCMDVHTCWCQSLQMMMHTHHVTSDLPLEGTSVEAGMCAQGQHKCKFEDIYLFKASWGLTQVCSNELFTMIKQCVDELLWLSNVCPCHVGQLASKIHTCVQWWCPRWTKKRQRKGMAIIGELFKMHVHVSASLEFTSKCQCLSSHVKTCVTTSYDS